MIIFRRMLDAELAKALGYNVEWKIKPNACCISTGKKVYITKYLDAEPGQRGAEPYIIEQHYPVEEKIPELKLVQRYSTDYRQFRKLEESLKRCGCYFVSFAYYINDDGNEKYVAKYVIKDFVTGDVKKYVIGEHRNETTARLLAIYKVLTGKDYTKEVDKGMW